MVPALPSSSESSMSKTAAVRWNGCMQRARSGLFFGFHLGDAALLLRDLDGARVAVEQRVVDVEDRGGALERLHAAGSFRPLLRLPPWRRRPSSSPSRLPPRRSPRLAVAPR